MGTIGGFVVNVGAEVWPPYLIPKRRTVTASKLQFIWSCRLNSALDSGNIAEDRDSGNHAVERRRGAKRTDAVYDLMFPFIFHTYVPDGKVQKT